MSSFTNTQDMALKQLLNKIIEGNQDQELVLLVKENELLSAVDKNAHHESMRADIDTIVENQGVKLTDEQKENILQIALSEYDYTDFDNYIIHLISKVK